jgi:uncharacterized protein
VIGMSGGSRDRDEREETVTRAVPALADLDFAPFVPLAPWWTGDLQTLRNYFRRRDRILAGIPQERLILPLADGSGDRLVASLSPPAAGQGARPLAVLIHGLSGDENSFYVLRSAAHLATLGYPVLRLNLRGAGPSRPLCRLQYHGGRSGDFADAIAALPPALTANGIVAVGFSLGGNMLLKFLGERGAAAGLRAAVSVSAPIDLAATSRRMLKPRNYAYQAYLLKEMRAEASAPIAALTPEERRALMAARSIWDFDERITAPRNGFAGAADFYARNSAITFLAGIAVPTLVVYARDDPWVPPEPYLGQDWRSNPHIVACLPERGGHIGFHAGDSPTPWHDRVIARFLDAALSRS